MGSDETLSGYSGSCLAVADDYIERATRFGSADLKVLGDSSETPPFPNKAPTFSGGHFRCEGLSRGSEARGR